MDKIKKVLRENKVLMVLAVILIICIVVLAVVSVTYFYGSSKDVYGDRLDTIKDVPLKNDFLKSIEKELTGNDNVVRAKVNLKGRIVYISADFNDGTKMDDAKKVMEEIVALFSEEELMVYDLNFTIKTKEYTLMGARNSSGSGVVVWNNYNIEEESTEE